jgi:hypothetical protein
MDMYAYVGNTTPCRATHIECVNNIRRFGFEQCFSPRSLLPDATTTARVNFEHFVGPMVHPVTGETISSYKKLMHSPAWAEVWQMAFGKDFGSMMHGDNKTDQKGTGAMFLMTHDNIKWGLADGIKITYGNPVVNYCPQKKDPHHICITAGGNLIHYESSPLVCTADLDTVKLHWNSVASTHGAKYMCLDIIFLSHRSIGLLQVHADATSAFSQLDSRTM